MVGNLNEEDLALQWALPESLDIPPDRLEVRLDFYGGSVIMHTVDKGVISTRLVSADDVVMALLSKVRLSSGLLPDDTIWWSQTANGAEVALWRKKQIWKVALMTEAFKPPRRFALPMPGLIFICQPARAPRVYAAKKRPQSVNEVIYHAPLFNLFQDGRVCPGTHKFPENVGDIPESFFTSFFTREAHVHDRSKKYPDNLLALWEELDGARRYPLGDLVPQGRIQDIMK